VSAPGNSAYRIGPLDVVDVTVFMVPDLSKTVQVAERGTINYPLVGELQAAGLTARDLERQLTEKLSRRYLQNPQINVFIKEYNSQRVTIEGAVKKPGIYPMQGEMSLLQALATAQGLEQISDDTVVVFRTAQGRRSAARFTITELRAGTTPDPKLEPGDVIIAGTSAFKEGLNTVVRFLPLASTFVLL
jgi:polysaccharide export outer membrane protein